MSFADQLLEASKPPAPAKPASTPARADRLGVVSPAGEPDAVQSRMASWATLEKALRRRLPTAARITPEDVMVPSSGRAGTGEPVRITMGWLNGEWGAIVVSGSSKGERFKARTVSEFVDWVASQVRGR